LCAQRAAATNRENDRLLLARSYEELGHAYRVQNRLDKAIETYRQALDIRTKLVAEFSKQDYKAYQSWTQQWIVDVLISQIQQAKADAELTEEQRESKAQELRDQVVKLVGDSINPGGGANDIAWRLATDPDQQRRDPTLAVELAKRAVELASEQAKGNFLNTL